MWGNRVFNLRYWIWALGKILPEWMRWDKVYIFLTVYIRFKFFNFNFCYIDFQIWFKVQSQHSTFQLCTILVILIQSLQGMEISRINSIYYLFYATSRNLFITTLISALNNFCSNKLGQALWARSNLAYGKVHPPLHRSDA